MRTEQYSTPTQIATRSIAENATTDGCCDIDEHKLAANWLLQAEVMRNEKPTTLQDQAMLDYFKARLIDVITQRL